MTNPKSLADLIREADAACPCGDPRCRIINGCGECCVCAIGTEQGSKCVWPGHAAIRAIVRACAEIGKTHDLVHLKGGLLCGAVIESVILAALKEEDGMGKHRIDMIVTFVFVAMVSAVAGYWICQSIHECQQSTIHRNIKNGTDCLTLGPGESADLNNFHCIFSAEAGEYREDIRRGGENE